MNHPLRYSASQEKKFLTPVVVCLLVLFFTGMAVGLYRFLFGLQAVTHLNNQYPFGIWIGIDMAGGVALAAGGFTTAALIHVFYSEHYAVIDRSAHLMAMLGYTFVVFGLLFDLGRWYNIWHRCYPRFDKGTPLCLRLQCG